MKLLINYYKHTLHIIIFMVLLFHIYPMSATSNNTSTLGVNVSLETVPQCSFSEYYSEQWEKCCSQCTAGTGLLALCSKGNDTICKPCMAGETHHSKKYHLNVCQSCTKCGENEYRLQECSVERNSVCKCIQGHYKDSTDGQCKECQKCTLGWGASPGCTASTNTVCLRCPDGSFSSTESSTRGCQMCTQCGPDAFSIKKCSATQDTNCFKTQQSSELAETDRLCQGKECGDRSYLYTAPLYCAVLGAIVLGLVIYVVLRCRKRKAAQNYPKLQYQPVNQSYQLPMNYVYTQANRNSRNHPLVYLQLPNTSLLTAQARYRDLGSGTRRAIQRGLSHDGCWLQLSHHLGFTPSEISQIQVKSQSDPKSQSPAYHLLHEWSHRESSTIGGLIQALAYINRLDLIALIHNSNVYKDSEPV